jgi:hypothetical protein
MPRRMRIGHPTYRLVADQGSIALTGRDADLVEGGSTAWTNPDPTVVDFTPAGTPSNVSFASYIPPGATNFRLHSSSAALPSGVTLDSDNQQFVYDGTGSGISDVTGIILEDYDDAEADWLERIGGAGVVWHHNFDNQAEVDRFRWTGSTGSHPTGGGNDPNSVGLGADLITWQSSGGADGGGFLRATYPANEPDGPGNSYWWRPFNALTGSGNGRGEDDPGDGGSITPVAFNSTSGSSTLYNWGNVSNPGWYLNSAYEATYPGDFQGNDFYLQVRVRRAQMPGPPPDEGDETNITGKNVWFTTTNDSYTNQEIVTYGQSAEEDEVGAQPRHRMYGGYNYSPFGGSQHNETLTLNNSNDVSDWRYSGDWDTLLYHITPGLNEGTGSDRTRIEVWAAQNGVYTYTKIWDLVYTAHFDPTSGGRPPGLPGWNALICGAYHNGSVFTTEDFHFDYDQIIFSKQTIPCPQV